MPEVLWWVRVQPGVLVPAQAWSVSLAQPLPPLSLLDKRPPTPRAPVRTQKSARAAGRYFAVGRGDLLCSPAPVPSQPSPMATVPRECVQVGAASPAGRDSRLPVLLQPSPGCPRVIWPRGLPAHLRVPLPLLVFTTSPRALPLPENLPAARPCSGWSPRALVPSAGCRRLLRSPLLAQLGAPQGQSLAGSSAFPASTAQLGSSSGSRCGPVPPCSSSGPYRGTARVLQVPGLQGKFLFHCACTVLAHLITKINIVFFISP